MLQSPKRRILVIAPHPDDEALATGGVIQEHRRQGHIVTILLMTCGDGQRRGLLLPSKHFLRLGERRYRESLEALRLLGVPEKRVIALGYPDRGLAHLCVDGQTPYTSRYTKVCAVPYEWAYSPGAPYLRESVLCDLKEILERERPDILYLPHPQDRHSDHRATYLLAQAALRTLNGEVERRHYLIHYRAWPLPVGKYPQRRLLPPRSLRDGAAWLAHELRPEQIERKLQAIRCYRSQTQYIEDHLLSFVRCNELFALG
ncbi:MAG: PIG-L family deacetylase [Candidatus Bipolaricaulota bacterium]|nr:PIG-L family deacetylase [Candidatus Bipolaricaulota bacterium]